MWTLGTWFQDAASASVAVSGPIAQLTSNDASQVRQKDSNA
jgi:hypothetical protein